MLRTRIFLEAGPKPRLVFMQSASPAIIDGAENVKSGARRLGVGLLHVMGVIGQILMHYAALIGQSWDEYIAAMRNGVKVHGPVRGGLYTMLEDRKQ